MPFGVTGEKGEGERSFIYDQREKVYLELALKYSITESRGFRA